MPTLLDPPTFENGENIPEKQNNNQDGLTEKKHRRKNATPRIVQPIALDLKKTEKRPSLKDFYLQKNPITDMERATVFAYYLKKYLGIPKIEPGHMVSCCRDVSAKIPSDIGMTFYNAQKRYAWLQLDEKGKAEISIQGENMIEGLPRKKNAPQGKTTA